MQLTIDTTQNTLTVAADGGICELPLFSPEAFHLISREWLRVGWGLKYSYSFTWLGTPIIQLPEDLVRIQELIWSLQPDVIVETGVAHGGSLILSASLCRLRGRGRVIGVDVEIRPHNRKAIEAHPMADLITLIEGNSVARSTVAQVRTLVVAGEKVMVILDSNHTKEHVLAELEAYGPLISSGSYIIATDGIMEFVADAPGAKPDWTWNNPCHAALEFVRRHPDFVITEPPATFDEGQIKERVTYWPSAFIKRL